MRIESLEISGFGTLDRVQMALPTDRLAVLVARNETGKSTLLAALEAALYGWPEAQRAEGRELRQRFRPWRGGASQVALTLHTGSARLRIVFDNLDSAGTRIERTTVYRDGQDVTDELRSRAGSPGEWLLGLSRDDFARVALVRQGDVAAVALNRATLVQQLEAVATSAVAGASAAGAVQRLRQAIEEYRDRAGLLHWSDGVLRNAKQWPRVERSLQAASDVRRQEQDDLEVERVRLAADLVELGAQEEEDDAWRAVRVAAERLAQAAAERTVSAQLAEDDRRRAELAQQRSQAATYADVANYDAAAVTEIHRLFEREAQQRRELALAAEELRDAERHLAECEAQRAAVQAVRPLVPLLADLRRALTLLEEDELAWRENADRRAATEAALERNGLARATLAALHAVLQAETLPAGGGEDASIVEVWLRGTAGERAAQRMASLDADLQRVQRAHIRGVRRALVVAVSGTLGAAVLAAALAWHGNVAGALSAGGLVALLVVCVTGALWWRTARCTKGNLSTLQRERNSAAQQAETYAAERAQIRRELLPLLRACGDSDAVSEGVWTEDVETLRRLAAWRTAALAEHAAARRLAERQRPWESWLEQIGAAPAEGTVSGRMARHEVARIEQAALLDESLAGATRATAAQRARSRQRRDDVRTVQLAVIARLAAVGIPVAAPVGPDALVPPEEFVVARQALAARHARWTERQKVLAACDVAAARLLSDEARNTLEAQRARLAATVRFTASPDPDDTPTLRAALQAARNHAALSATLDRLLGSQSWHTDSAAQLAAIPSDRWEAVTRELREQLEQRVVERARRRSSAREFRQRYAARIPVLTAELETFQAELLRGQRFSQAIDITVDVLTAVQADSYGLWAPVLHTALASLLARWLPDYDLAEIGRGLEPLLVHRPTGTTLDLGTQQRHLSRGALDRLYLALRLALVEVLESPRGAMLPLWLDDTLANWDDVALVEGLRLLMERARRRATVLLLTCQGSRIDAARAALGAEAGALEVVPFE
ncbi:MAG: AAA family ATPase [Phycisphaerales bacterium]|nr:AAA family ATPase [Phycisphaerales bacterium]